MRLWSLHPGYLDAKGLVALWREGLLAQKVLLGATRGYKLHPQLIRFRHAANPVGAIAGYLRAVADEADKRGFHFDRHKIARRRTRERLPVSSGQLEYEFVHLLGKLRRRAPALGRRLEKVSRIKLHPSFRRVRGAVVTWEVVPPPR